MTLDKRGKASYYPTTRAINKHGNPCCRLKSHFKFDSSYRTVIGLAERTAALDPERFIWIQKWTQLQRQDGKKKRQLFYCLSFFEALGLLTPAYRFRNGASRHGYVVASHDDISSISSDGKLCTLLTQNPSMAARRKRGQRRNASACQNARSASRDAFESASASASQNSPECISSDAILMTDSELVRRRETLGSAIPVNPVNSVNSVRENPVEDHHQNPSLSHSTSIDPDKIHGQGKTNYGERLYSVDRLDLSKGRFREIIAAATGDEIDISKAKRYPHIGELARACVEAVESLSDESWPEHAEAGFARMMGCVMDVMAARGLEVPKAWVACLSDFRRTVRRKRENRFLSDSEATELHNSLRPPESPWFYLQNRIITRAEYETLVWLADMDYHRHEEFYVLSGSSANFGPCTENGQNLTTGPASQ